MDVSGRQIKKLILSWFQPEKKFHRGTKKREKTLLWVPTNGPLFSKNNTAFWCAPLFNPPTPSPGFLYFVFPLKTIFITPIQPSQIEIIDFDLMIHVLRGC